MTQSVMILAPATEHISPEHRVMYVKSGNKTVDHSYVSLLCRMTLDADFVAQLKAQGCFEIAHLKGATYYTTLLQGKGYPPVEFAVEDDSGITGLPLKATKTGQQGAGERFRRGFRRADSFRWGCVSFLYKSRQEGKKVIECVCPRRSHARFRQTRGPTFCSFSMTCQTAQEELDVVRRLKHWAAQSMKFPDKAKHQQYRAPLEDCPMDADIERMLSDREATPDRELPCRGVHDLERRPRRHGRGEASGRVQAGGVAVAAREARGRDLRHRPWAAADRAALHALARPVERAVPKRARAAAAAAPAGALEVREAISWRVSDSVTPCHKRDEHFVSAELSHHCCLNIASAGSHQTISCAT